MNLGELARGETRRDEDGCWWHRCVDCGAAGVLDHEVSLDQRGRVLVWPSILCTSCGAHYWVRGGEVAR